MSKGAKKAATLRLMALSLAFGDTPPTEFRIFAAGENTTTKGAFLFDDAAAREVMAAYKAHGIDVMIDLEHLSVESPQESRNFDPDARGWCRLEIRNGELWAVGVTWTPDGLARLTNKTQRYISPVFAWEGAAKRIVELFNIAITAMPATDHLQPLVGAARRQRLTFYEGDAPMTPEQFIALAEALGLGADANVEDVLATVAAMVKKIQDAANGVTPDDAAGDIAPPAAAANAPPMIAAARVVVAIAALARLSGKKEIGAVLVEVQAWRKSHLELEKQTTELAAERKTLEQGERHRLVAELVKLGTEAPATAWADDDAKAPAEPWASMPIERLRDRVAKLAQAKGKGAGSGDRSDLRIVRGGNNDGAGGTRPGKTFTVNGTTVELSASELEACEDMKAKPEDYARNKLIRSKARG